MHQVISVDKGSLGARHKIVPGDIVVSINGEPLIDDVDYQALTARRRVTLEILKEDGSRREVDILKREISPLGLHFAETLICDPRSCSNNCVFCFVDQMPTGMRNTLYVKDDDWRLSLMMGNFVTLTNVGDREFERIIRRKASPLYISVHATDPDVREGMMRQKHARKLMPRLERLKQEGIDFHCQVVLCPGINDGPILERTLSDLLALRPAAKSVALVPVGLTKFRDNLTQLMPYDESGARQVLEICGRFQAEAMDAIGSSFVFPADEFICLAKAPLPSYDSYEGFPQIENGIGMIRLMDTDLQEAKQASATSDVANQKAKVLLCCGTSIQPYMRTWASAYAAPGVEVEVRAIRNIFFGETVTVSGLVVGQDLAQQLFGTQADLILLPGNMLNADKTLFLDDMSPAQLEEILGVPVRIIPPTGHALFNALQQPLALLAQEDNVNASL